MYLYGELLLRRGDKCPMLSLQHLIIDNQYQGTIRPTRIKCQHILLTSDVSNSVVLLYTIVEDVHRINRSVIPGINQFHLDISQGARVWTLTEQTANWPILWIRICISTAHT